MKNSAGLVMYKRNPLRVFLIHPGGPFWKGKDKNAWSIPKGEVEENEDQLSAAKREFREETGIRIKQGTNFLPLGTIRQNSRKFVTAWAFEGDWNGFLMKQSMIEIEFPYKSGKKIRVPEVDKAGFFTIEKAKQMIVPGQFGLIEKLAQLV